MSKGCTPEDILAVITLLLALTAHAGPDADKILAMLEQRPPDLERAQKRCDKWEAHRMSTEQTLRDACARAFWYPAEVEDSVEGWRAYRERWAGTKGEAPALEREARALLLALGKEATEEAYSRLTRQYPGTKAADIAAQMAEHRARQGISGVSDALRVMRQYPEQVPDLLEQYLGELVTVEVQGLDIRAKLRQDVPTPEGVELETLWAARHADGTLVPWDDEARAHLRAGGLPAEALNRLDGSASGRTPRRYPLCHDPTAPPGWGAGVAVRLGEASVFQPQPWSKECGPDSWPVFLTVRGSRVTSLSLLPGHLMQFPTQRASTGFTWGAAPDGTGGTDLYLPFDPGEPVTVANAQVVGQQLGPLYLVHPVGGGLPWITNMRPPTNTIPLTSAFESTRMPAGWAVVPGAGGSSRVEGAYPPQDGPWTLPPGSVRVLTPLVQWATGLHRRNPKVTGVYPEPLPSLATPGAWKRSRVLVQAAPPQGAQPLTLTEATPDQLDRAMRTLTDAGLELHPSRGWVGNLDKDTRDELVLEAERGGVSMRVVVDAYASGARRVFLFDAADTPGFESRRGQQFAFVRGGTPYVAWTGMDGSAFVEAIHLDDRGLVREVLR